MTGNKRFPPSSKPKKTGTRRSRCPAEFRPSRGGYLWIDASDMEAAINAIGGLTMELSEEEAAYFALSSSQDSFLEGGFTAGEHTLTGSQALFFTRVRMGTDYDRMIRQQKLAESLLRQIWNDPLQRL